MHAALLPSASAATPAPLSRSVARFVRTVLLLLPAIVAAAGGLGCTRAPALALPPADEVAVIFVRQMFEASPKSMVSAPSSNSAFVLLLMRVPAVAALLSALLHQRSVNRFAVRVFALAAALGISQMLLILAKCATSSVVLVLQLSTAK